MGELSHLDISGQNTKSNFPDKLRDFSSKTKVFRFILNYYSKILRFLLNKDKIVFYCKNHVLVVERFDKFKMNCVCLP